MGEPSSFSHMIFPFGRSFGQPSASWGSNSTMIAAMKDLPADAIAYFGKTDYVILISLALPYRVREFLTNQLLGLICSDGPPKGLTIPTGEGERMLAAPLSDPLAD